MRKLALLLFPIILLSCLHFPDPNEGVLLRYKFTTGQKVEFEYTETGAAGGVLSALSGATQVETSLSVWGAYLVTAVREGKQADIEFTLSRIVMREKAPGKTEYDSNEPSGAGAEWRPLGLLINKKFALKVGAGGAVVAFDTSPLDALAAGAGKTSTALFSFASLLLNECIEAAFIRMPARPVMWGESFGGDEDGEEPDGAAAVFGWKAFTLLTVTPDGKYAMLRPIQYLPKTSGMTLTGTIENGQLFFDLEWGGVKRHYKLVKIQMKSEDGKNILLNMDTETEYWSKPVSR